MEPKRFTPAPGQIGNLASAAFPFLVRLGSGGFASGYSSKLTRKDDSYAVLKVGGWQVKETSRVGSFKRPQKPIELYEYETCPFCRRVREAVAVLDLEVLYRPCPANGPMWRAKAREMGGKASFPFMYDPNTETQMYESGNIIKYLFENYSDGQTKPPWGLMLGPLTAISCTLGMLPRGRKGGMYSKARQPQTPLILWSYEASPFCKVVREVLCELELPFVQQTVSRGSPRRQELYDQEGHFQVPFLQDPNTGASMFESADIMQ
eukprot:jgi/Astpho2/220/fgenesh1_pm.00010_%23_5_t